METADLQCLKLCMVYLHCHCISELLSAPLSTIFLLNIQVNTIHNGKTALQCSATAGNISVMKILLEFNPDLEFEVSDGCL